MSVVDILRGIVGEHCPYDFGWMWQELGVSALQG